VYSLQCPCTVPPPCIVYSSKGSLTFSTPTGKFRPRKKKIFMDGFTNDVIRRKIHEFYVDKKTPPTLSKLKAVLEEEGILKCSREHLRRILKSIGFKWLKSQTNRKILMEKPEVVMWRAQYLREIRQFRRENRRIIYLDETYVNKNHTAPHCWQSDLETGATKSVGKGPRLVIVHAGSEQGFVPNALRIWQSDKKSKKSDDYHDEMNFTNFSKWVKEDLLPNVPPKCVIVLDNASYHNKQDDKKPTSASLKQQIIDWLMKKKI
jgi:transposase